MGTIRFGKITPERVIETLIYGSAWAVIGSLVLIFVFIGKEALPLFFSAHVREEIDFFRLFSPPPIWQPVGAVPKYSFIPLIIGTLKVTLVSLVVAIPISLGAAIFTSEFSPPQLREWIKPVIELLAGIPSVVLGFFCLLVLASWMQDMFHFTFRLNAITAGIGLGLAVIPIVYTVAEDALSAVPQSFREASMAMGASPWQTAWKVVFPAAFPGIFAACVLGFGRAIGETMIVLMASGNAAITSWAATDSLRTFSATIAAELAEVVVGSAHYHILFFIGVFLLSFTFLTNILAHWFVKRLQGRLEGKG